MSATIDNERRLLVTIGIPTFERPAELERAVRSALAQHYSTIEVLVSDNASSDPAVAQVGSRLAAADPRVRFVSQPRNQGHAANFQWLLQAARGDYFMWLSDDDWIDPEYVSRCVAALTGDDGTSLVCGLGRYYRDGAHVLDERPIDLDSARAGLRLVRYFARVSLNGPMFGVARRQDLLAVGFPPVVGGDWLLIASLAARGRVRTLEDVHIHRSLSGLGGDEAELARSFGMRGAVARQHHAVMAARMWRGIALEAPAFGDMNPVARVGVGTAAAALILARFSLTAAMRRALGRDHAASVEGRVSAWLRARDAR